MKSARDFRQTAWDTLRGRYWWAVLAALIAIVLGGQSGQSPIRFEFSDLDLDNIRYYAQRAIEGRLDLQVVQSALLPIGGIIAALGSIAFVYAVGIFIVGGAVELGYDLFNLSLYESHDAPRIETLFSRFSIFGQALLLRLLMAIKIFLWSLLFIIPGIIAAYRYAMAPYLMAENPNLSATDAIDRSKEMMYGHKSRLFWLQLSFIGWFLLSALTGGIGFIFLSPYTKAAETAFYLDLSGRLERPAASSGQHAEEGGGREFI